MNYKTKTIVLIAIATLIRCIIASTVELGNDEVYYRIWASHLQWNYFDHPPFVAFLIRLSNLNLFLDSDLFIRLGAILCAAGSTWIIFLAGKKLANEQSGFFAAGIYTASIYGSIVAGTFILPDSPQMLCWTGCLYLLIGFAETSHIRKTNKRNLLWFAVVCGLGMLCKIHTIFLWFAVILYIVMYNRKWLLEPVLYIAGLITLLFFYPVIKWNIDNQFISFFYHSSRVDMSTGGLNYSSFLQFILGQVLYCNPIIFGCLLVTVVAALKNQLPLHISQKRILLATSLPLIILATLISLSKTVLPHWPGPAYSGLIILAGCYFGKRKKNLQLEKRLFPLPVAIANILLVLIIFSGVLVINFLPGTMGIKSKQQRGDGDFTLDMYGWRSFANSFDSIYYQNRKQKNTGVKTFILSNKWFPAAHIDHYIADHLGLKVVVPGVIEDIHQYKWLNEKLSGWNDSVYLYVILPSNYNKAISEFPLLKNKKAKAVYTIPQKRNGAEARNFNVYYFDKDRYNLTGMAIAK